MSTNHQEVGTEENNHIDIGTRSARNQQRKPSTIRFKSFKVSKVSPAAVRIGVLLAMVGGFLDAYTFVGRGGVFSNAQTGNIVLLGISLAQANWAKAITHIPPIIAFVLGVFIVQMLKLSIFEKYINSAARMVLIIEISVLVIVGFVPNTVSDLFVSTIISFVSSLQIATFKKLTQWNYNTAMTTGNLRTATEALWRSIFEKDTILLKQAGHFYGIIFCFFIGAWIGAVLTLHLHTFAIWIAAALLFVAFISLEKNKG